jgi:hypothetical protein
LLPSRAVKKLIVALGPPLLGSILALIKSVFILMLLLPGCYAVTASRTRFERTCVLAVARRTNYHSTTLHFILYNKPFAYSTNRLKKESGSTKLPSAAQLGGNKHDASVYDVYMTNWGGSFLGLTLPIRL